MGITRDLVEADRTIPANLTRNKIINGGFDIWQRGTSQSNIGYGSADRWILNLSGATGTLSQLSNSNIQDNYGIKSKYRARISTTVADNNTGFLYKIEDVTRLTNRHVTLSFWVYNALNTQPFKINIFQAHSSITTISNIKTFDLANGWTKIEEVFDLDWIGDGLANDPNSYTGLEIACTDNALVDFSICDVQLEEGTVATPFEQRHIGHELALCQRYYEKVERATHTSYVDTANTSDYVNQVFAVKKRITPSITISSISSIIGDGTPTIAFTKETHFVSIMSSGRTSTYFNRSAFDFEADAEL